MTRTNPIGCILIRSVRGIKTIGAVKSLLTALSFCEPAGNANSETLFFQYIRVLRYNRTINQYIINDLWFRLFSIIFPCIQLSRQKFAKSRQKCCRYGKRLYLCSAIQFSNLWQQYHYHYPQRRTRQRGNLKSLSVS